MWCGRAIGLAHFVMYTAGGVQREQATLQSILSAVRAGMPPSSLPKWPASAIVKSSHPIAVSVRPTHS